MDLDFYFNEWAFLAQTSPALFEKRRLEAIEAFLGRSGVHRQRLEALQSKIDEQRELAATPERAVAAISELMCASLTDLAGEMSKLVVGLKAIEARALPKEARRKLAA